VVAGVGVRPAVGFLEGSGLLRDGVVPVDATLQTEAEDIYAAGDIALVPSHYSGESHRIEHWTVAERQGQHAARAMLGSDAAYDEPPFFWTKQYKASIKYIGHAPDYDHIAYYGNVEEGKFAAGYYQDGALRAVAVLGLSDLAILAGMLLRQGKSIAPKDFESPDLDLARYL
jgi:NADPH-dependent 2,4-dienoyl-CoA reductase/sulfur reductase-like enzyme